MVKPIVFTILSLSLAACDTGPYTPSSHRAPESASTGSMLSGTDTGVSGNGSMSDPSIRSNEGFGPSAGGK